MARILQDGFETEGKILPSSDETGYRTDLLDVGVFCVNSTASSSSYVYSRSGVSAPRGGYGKQSYCIRPYTSSGNHYSCCMKYELSKFTDNTNELFYRVWVNPKSGAKIIPFSLTSIEFEKQVSSKNHTFSSFLKNCNTALYMEKKDDNTYKIHCYCNNVVVYTYDYLFFNQWVKIDVRVKIGDANTGIFQLRINDKLITTFNGTTGASNPKYLYIGIPYISEAVSSFLEIDDIAINDTTGNVNNSWCGNGSIVGIVPTANGSKTMFTPGIEGSQNFENVDDLSSDGDATYNSSYALNDVDLFKFTIPEELEIPPTETINAISVTTSAKFVEQPTDIGHIVSDGVTDTLIKHHIISNNYTQQSSIIQEKSDGTKYKVSDIEGLEFGYKTLESSRTQEE